MQALPMEEFVTRQDLERCSLHDLRVRAAAAHAMHAGYCISLDDGSPGESQHARPPHGHACAHRQQVWVE